MLSTTPISAQVPAETLIGEAKPRTGLREPLVATRVTEPFVIDGRVTEAAWLAIEPLRAVVSQPNFGAAPSERTEFRIAYDDEYLYVSGVLRDRDPDGIRRTSLRCDDGSLSNAWFAVTIDGYRDRENSLTMAVTPAGVRTDLEAPDDAEGAINFAWNAFWDAEVARTDTGWSAELRIPFSSLPCQPDANGITTMGITI
ncbi:MAG: hypothetical protein EA351_01400 [Gemmatimonadales bacterium]|nr:MAG: hypothetical protein EA351_01400 [Gemmatimonadales bacterium]